jgi:hypothetical protein
MASINDLLDAPQVATPTDSALRGRLAELVNQALSVAVGLVPSDKSKEFYLLPRASGVGIALSAAMQSVSGLLSAGAIQCNRATPPADIEMKMDATGRLIYRCYHAPSHEWDLTGVPRP